MFWGIRTNDEGIGRSDNFFALVNAGNISLVAPARAEGYGADGRSVILDDGRSIRADAVILATGFTSSWRKLFDRKLRVQG